MGGRPLLDPATVPAGIRPVSVALVGAYGLRIVGARARNRHLHLRATSKPSLAGRDRRHILPLGDEVRTPPHAPGWPRV
jgi:hypothetical protein